MGIIAALVLLGFIGIGYGRGKAVEARDEDDAYVKAQQARLAAAQAQQDAQLAAYKKAIAAADAKRRLALTTAARMPTTPRATANKTTITKPQMAGVSLRGDEDLRHL